MLQPTNLVVVQQAMMYTSSPQATPIDICDQCGGLFARPGPMFFGLPHAH